jgi:carboxypeptidase C (cathepsin A)
MAENLLAGIKDFLKAFKLEKREFYVSGESYAGVYIPYLATHMINDDSDDKVNLKGVLIGNGLTDYDTDVERSMVDFGFYHGLISIETYNIFKRRCPHKPDELSPEEEAEYQQELKDGFYPRNVTHECNEIRNVIRQNLQGSDIYGIYRLCPTRPKLSLDDPLYLNKKFTMKNTILQKLIQYKNKENNFDENEKLGKLEPENDVFPSGCWDDMTIDLFLNEAEVKRKLAVYSESMRWTQCFDVNYDMGDSFAFYSEIMKDHYDEVKVWVFSGTEDGVLPTLGTLRWIDKLGFNIETKWRQWKVGKQVAGYVQKYEEGLVVVTVKGAGHMVPQDQRAAAFNMVSAFFKGVLP